VLRKGEKVARCVLGNQLGWELRLMTHDLLRCQVCRSSEEILQTYDEWKAAMIVKIEPRSADHFRPRDLTLRRGGCGASSGSDELIEFPLLDQAICIEAHHSLSD